jgi:hypothetical protein
MTLLQYGCIKISVLVRQTSGLQQAPYHVIAVVCVLITACISTPDTPPGDAATGACPSTLEGKWADGDHVIEIDQTECNIEGVSLQVPRLWMQEHGYHVGESFLKAKVQGKRLKGETLHKIELPRECPVDVHWHAFTNGRIVDNNTTLAWKEEHHHRNQYCELVTTGVRRRRYTRVGRLLSLTVTNGSATQEYVTGAKNWATIKRDGDYVIVEAKTVPNEQNVWKRIKWSGDTGNAVPGKSNQRRIRRSIARKYHIEAELDGQMDYVDLWVIWADIEVRTKGAPPRGSSQFELGARDGTQKLGAVTYPSLTSSLIQGQYVANYGASAKVAPVATIAPKGVHYVLKNGWAFKRERMSRNWIDGKPVESGNDRNINWNTKWVDDTSPRKIVKLTPDVHDRIYDLDAPDIYWGEKNYELYHNFRQWIEWGGERCSDYAEWYWRVRWQAHKDPRRQIILNDLGTGNKPLPKKAYFKR